jgi:Dolichyl-phosphate-mannose-protein mannosyltransferase
MAVSSHEQAGAREDFTSLPPAGSKGGPPAADRRWRSANRATLQTLGVVLLGLSSAVVYLLLTLEMTFIQHFPGDGFVVFFIQVYPDEGEGVAVFVGAFTALFAAFLPALFLVRRGASGPVLLALFVFPVAFAAILTFMYPPFSTDFLHNVADARTIWRFGDNPLITPPQDNPFPIDQIWGDEPAPYGPLWFLLLFPVVISGDDVELALHVLKAYNALFYVGSAFLVFLIARRLTPGREAFAFALYAWNPFVVMRTAGDGHNDVVMFFFVLLAFWAMVSEKWRYVLPALVAAVLIKYVPILLIPPVLLIGYAAVDDRRWFVRENLVGGALAALLAAAAFAPFLEGGLFDQVVSGQSERFANSIWLALQVQLQERGELSFDDASEFARWAGYAFFGVAYLFLMVALWRSERRLVDVIACSGLMMLALAAGLSWFMPWYFLWSIPLLVLAPGRWPVALVLALSLGGMAPELLTWYGSRWNYFVDHYTTYVVAIVALIFGAALLVVGGAWLLGRKPLMVDRSFAEGAYRGAAPSALRTTTESSS